MTVLDAGAVAGFPCTLARGVVRWGCVCVYLCAPGFVNGVWWCVRVARFVSGGVFYYVRRGVPAWLFVCRLCPALSHVAGLLLVCFVCRLLCGVRFVSAPAPTVTWFMQVCAGVHLTATVVVVYCLPCNGRFQRFALFTGMPVVFVSVSYRHKGWWGESGVRGRWRLVARRTT